MSHVIVEETRLDDKRALHVCHDRGAIYCLQPCESTVRDEGGRGCQHQCCAKSRARVAHGAPDELDAGLIRIDQRSATFNERRRRRRRTAVERHRACVVEQMQRLDSQQRAACDQEEPLERLFLVTSGALLRIESLHLLNNASSMSFDGCSAATTPPFIECRGTLIYAYQARVELVGCTVRDTRAGFSAALMLTTSTSLVTNCTFTRLETVYRSAIMAYMKSTFVVESSLFHDNVAHEGAIVGTCKLLTTASASIPS